MGMWRPLTRLAIRAYFFTLCRPGRPGAPGRVPMNTDMSVSLASVRPMVMPETLTCQCSWHMISVHGLHGSVHYNII